MTEYVNDADFTSATADTAQDDPSSFLHQDPHTLAILNSFRAEDSEAEKKLEQVGKKEEEEEEEGVVTAGDEEPKPLDYNLYRTFWHVQSILTTSSAEVNTTEKAQDMVHIHPCSLGRHML